MSERATPAAAGLIVVDKPSGTTSRRVVDAVARALGMAAVGHAGTLDPLARGVMLVCVGHATRLVDFLHELPKAYRGTFLFGRWSPSDDLETPVEHEAAAMRPSREAVEAAAETFRGEILQRPCDYSAVHVGGRRAYRLARAGRTVTLEPKRVRIDRLQITGYDWPRLEVEVDCSSGTFIRALGRDLAAAVGTRAVMEGLVRTAVGPFALARAVPLERIDPATVRAALLPPVAALPHLPQRVLDEPLLAHTVRGGLVAAADVASPVDAAAAPVAIAALDAAGDLVGILRQLPGGTYRLRPNFRGAG